MPTDIKKITLPVCVAATAVIPSVLVSVHYMGLEFLTCYQLWFTMQMLVNLRLLKISHPHAPTQRAVGIYTPVSLKG
jgi:hypothetical protein